MKRTIIRQGSGSFTLTLPKEWVEKHHLSKEAVVDVTEKNESLLISPHLEPVESIVRIVLPRVVYNSTLRNAVLAAYVAGAQEITVEFSSPYCIRIDRITYKKSKVLLLDELKELMTALIGMEVIRQTKNRIIIKELASGNPERFTSTLNRAFFIMEELIEETATAISEKKNKLALQSFFSASGVNKLHQYCLRLLKQYGFEEYDKTIFVARLLTSMDTFTNQLKVLLRAPRKISKDEEVLVFDLKKYLERSREALQKKHLTDAMLLMQEVKDVRISVKSVAIKDCYDTLDELIVHVIECCI